ncbi:MAG: hypothetical protein WCJ39_01715 [bacterium]
MVGEFAVIVGVFVTVHIIFQATVAGVPTETFPGWTVSVQVGLGIGSKVHVGEQVYPAGTPSLPSHSSVGDVEAQGTIAHPIKIPFFPSVVAVHTLFGLSCTPSPHFAI